MTPSACAGPRGLTAGDPPADVLGDERGRAAPDARRAAGVERRLPAWVVHRASSRASGRTTGVEPYQVVRRPSYNVTAWDVWAIAPGTPRTRTASSGIRTAACALAERAAALQHA